MLQRCRPREGGGPRRGISIIVSCWSPPTIAATQRPPIRAGALPNQWQARSVLAQRMCTANERRQFPSPAPSLTDCLLSAISCQRSLGCLASWLACARSSHAHQTERALRPVRPPARLRLERLDSSASAPVHPARPPNHRSRAAFAQNPAS